jgi:A/G-specific adenine glycosylase
MDREARKEIAEKLVKWYESKGRQFPWRKEGLQPYGILIAEMMLQKTRAEMVERVYCDFLGKYPNPQTLAATSVEEVARCLKPLGLYNRRARWMKVISETLVSKYQGKLPKEKKDLMDLPGIGAYIAHAILCFAHNKPVPLVDVNIARVLGRVASIQVSGDLRRNRKLHKVAAELVPKKKFKEFNWALVDLGALVCTSTNPKHHDCPIASLCKFVAREKFKNRRKKFNSVKKSLY